MRNEDEKAYEEIKQIFGKNAAEEFKNKGYLFLNEAINISEAEYGFSKWNENLMLHPHERLKPV